jgi:serine/threonine protein kinase, bacterial
VKPPAVITKARNGTRVDTELIRKDRIAPAVRLHEWTRATVGAANGLQAAG